MLIARKVVSYDKPHALHLTLSTFHYCSPRCVTSSVQFVFSPSLLSVLSVTPFFALRTPRYFKLPTFRRGTLIKIVCFALVTPAPQVARILEFVLDEYSPDGRTREKLETVLDIIRWACFMFIFLHATPPPTEWRRHVGVVKNYRDIRTKMLPVLLVFRHDVVFVRLE